MFDLPRPNQLGPDPEPLDTERAERLMARTCPLSQATGHSERCTMAHCPWYRVPGTVTSCAVEQWSPRARRDPRLAAWFIARRAEIIRGRLPPSPMNREGTP